LLAAGDLEAASAYSREALRAHPEDARLLVLMADLKYRASDLAAAEMYLRTASHIAPRDPIVGLDLGLVLKERGNTREAREWFERVAASGPAPLAERARQELRR
jgi:Flp pilus assembly protein TadD